MTPAATLSFRKPVQFLPVPTTAPVHAIPSAESATPSAAGKYLPFLPSNFYDAPQYAAFRPIRISSDQLSTSKQLISSVQARPSSTGIRQRKNLRTVSTLFDPDRRLTGAKINLESGVLTRHDYKDYFVQGPKARRNPNAPDIEPFWMKMPAATRGTGPAPQQDKSRNKLHNGCKMYLQHLQWSDDLECALLAPPLSDAVAQELPMLTDIIESANLLDMGGSTRGLNRSLMLSMLCTLDVITPITVQDFMACSVRHSQRVAACLRVIVTAFMMRAEATYPQADF